MKNRASLQYALAAGSVILVAACGTKPLAQKSNANASTSAATSVTATDTQTATSTSTVTSTATSTSTQTHSSTSTATATESAHGGAAVTTFGTNGKLDLPTAGIVIVGNDGSTLYVIRLATGGSTVNRLTESGEVDTTFGTNGVASASFTPPGVKDPTYVRALQTSDGGFAILGPTTLAASSPIYAIRLNAAGALNAAFGTSGIATGPTGYGGTVTHLDLAADGSIYAGIYGSSGANQNLTAKVLSNGTFDPSFGNQGVSAVGTEIGMQSTKVLAYSADATNSSRVIHRLNADGSVDGTFVPSAASFAMAVQSTGKPIELPFGHNVLPERLGLNGGSDPSFGVAGIVSLGETAASGTYFPLTVTIGNDDGIYLQALAPTLQLSVYKLSADGKEDPDFGDAGTITPPQQCATILALKSGKLVCVTSSATTLYEFGQ